VGVDKIETFGPPSPSSPPTKGRGKNFRKLCLVAAMLRCDSPYHRNGNKQTDENDPDNLENWPCVSFIGFCG
jgi:hypothetical protein